MKIGVVGCGALGSYYGAKLCRAGADVHFLLRSDYEVVRRQGVRILSPEGDFTVRPRSAREPMEIGVCELVLIGLKTTANEQFPRLLPPMVGEGTAVLTLQNGLGNEEALAELFPVEQILGGLCFVCLNRTEPGVIQHLAHGKIILGEFRRRPLPRTYDLAGRFKQAGIPCKVVEDLESAHWEKLVWNIPFNGLGVASAAGYESVVAGEIRTSTSRGACLTTDRLLDGGRWEALVVELMQEVIAAANGMGLGLSREIAGKQVERTRVMGAYKPSTLVDFERGQPLELEHLFQEPLRRARAAGVPAPRLTSLCRALERLSAVP
ncbi:MAG TPA: 2-dehydropantoate 2-reductase [Methylomirabilota bacterium]|nr:2-dehydropantoate 2-reductase [Methylomirabilota bacterium]